MATNWSDDPEELERQLEDAREELGWALGDQLVATSTDADLADKVGALRLRVRRLEDRLAWVLRTREPGFEPTDYGLLAKQVAALAEDGTPWVSGLANASSAMSEALPATNWVGFYLTSLRADGTPELVVGPFQGRPGCTPIAYGRGVCGTAAQADRTQLVPDVHDFPGHIACDSASASELVVPLHAGGQVIGVIDLDSPVAGRFAQADADGMALVARALEPVLAGVLPLRQGQ